MRLHHVAFRTGDLAQLERFYVDTLGLAVVRRHEDRAVWLDAGGTLVMLEKRASDEAPLPPDSRELLAFAIDPDKCVFYTHRLAQAGAPVEARTRYTLYVRDPDGRRIGLSSYPVELG